MSANFPFQNLQNLPPQPQQCTAYWSKYRCGHPDVPYTPYLLGPVFPSGALRPERSKITIVLIAKIERARDALIGEGNTESNIGTQRKDDEHEIEVEVRE
ncbi:hypothetical protein BPOR_0198g00160 [Botrytis porri]|uniref:Uncharacterized protein n=1 Tax=Botrytis porri TaxID=87229 RepID=A0A4Z1KTP0_9HELO|nr:hypothetical protein BPOR_0198g00160 [Botrytis porri]